MTLSKLARLANVSVSVVSKAFSGREGVSETMREHVFAVAREHGCFQHFYHAPYDRPVVAVIIPEAISKNYIHYIEALKERMEQKNYTMLLSISNFDRQLADELVRYYVGYGKVNGLLLLTSVNELPKNCSTAIVSLGMENAQGAVAHIHHDLRTGIAEALCQLKAMGHTKFGYIGEPFTESKRGILIEELERLGLEVRQEWFISSLSRFEEAGRDGVRRILQTDEKPTAIFGAYGYITQGMIAELAEKGMRIPQQMSVISMDNDPFPLDDQLDVACIPSNVERICDVALALLGEQMQKKQSVSASPVVLPSSFYYGNSIQPI